MELRASASGRDEDDQRERLLERAEVFFPVRERCAWSRFERAVFNNLMDRLIDRHGYAAISDAMLLAAADEMQAIVQRLGPRLVC